ncbi:MAG: hypothetical protein JJU29_12730 [Verrucomicrobia bacterium]|nr:hypothetical protein [Verrucomicrobiota bacterium]MCH8512638.1 hypothetical protein [Kiritimatiellia bacterium]
MSKKLEDWNEWKEVCSVVGCEPGVQSRLAEFINAVGWKYLIKWSIEPGFAEPDRPVSCFDQKLWVEETRKGKRWKDHMMAYAAQPQNVGHEIGVLRKYAANMIRTAIKKHLIEEKQFFPVKRRIKTVSGDKPLGTFDGDTGKCLFDLTQHQLGSTLREVLDSLVTTDDEAAYKRAAAEVATQIWEGFLPNEQVALTGYGFGLPKSHPILLKYLGVEKSQASVKLLSIMRRIESHLAELFPEDDEECVFYLAKHVMTHLQEQMIQDMKKMPRDLQEAIDARTENSNRVLS